MKSLFFLLMAPLLVLNLLGGLVGGVWLAILGDWSTLFFRHSLHGGRSIRSEPAPRPCDVTGAPDGRSW
jgi:hypothetical protein